MLDSVKRFHANIMEMILNNDHYEIALLGEHHR